MKIESITKRAEQDELIRKRLEYLNEIGAIFSEYGELRGVKRDRGGDYFVFRSRRFNRIDYIPVGYLTRNCSKSCRTLPDFFNKIKK